MTEQAFSGAKIAILCGDEVLSLLRDDRPDIPFPGLWDLPGGGREGAETPEETALRELEEETGLLLDPALVVWREVFDSWVAPGRPPNWFLVAEVPEGVLDEPVLGDEGQELRWFEITEFLELNGAIPHMQTRLRVYLAERQGLGPC
ncbi:NUDIX domain-containing protein [Pseudoruegeria sp. HB172150]|uniref:NUDIX domain-containing protein n=1 Tax=Pseudoruegeria sp. HB172150 TaxID=2721164 RepID=UPI001556918A